MRRCQFCGHVLADGDAFCRHCGRSPDPHAPPPPPAPAPPGTWLRPPPPPSPATRTPQGSPTPLQGWLPPPPAPPAPGPQRAGGTHPGLFGSRRAQIIVASVSISFALLLGLVVFGSFLSDGVGDLDSTYLSQRWSAPVGSLWRGETKPSAPVLAVGPTEVVSADAGGRVDAFSIGGSAVWSADLPVADGAPRAVLAVGPDFLVRLEHAVVVVDGSSGSVTWTHPLGDGGVAPVALDDVVLVSDAGSVVALDRVTGAVVWTRPIVATQVQAQFRGHAAIIQSDAGTEVLDGATGVRRWQQPVPGTVASDAMAVYVEADATITAYDLLSGARRWTVPGQGLVGADGTQVFLADDRATLTALSPKDGIADWTTDALGSEFEFPAEVTVHAHGGGITVSSVPWGTVAVLDSATGGVARTPIRYDAASTGVPGSGDADLVVISSAEILEQTRHQPASRQSSQWTITVYGLD